MAKASPDFDTVQTSQYDYSVMHYTSGHHRQAQGRRSPAPGCGAAVRHREVGARPARGRRVLVHRRPGWVTGTSYGMLAPWTNGLTQLIYEGGFRASAWYEMIQKHKVTVWVHRPDGHQDADEGGGGAAAPLRPVQAQVLL